MPIVFIVLVEVHDQCLTQGGRLLDHQRHHHVIDALDGGKAQQDGHVGDAHRGKGDHGNKDAFQIGRVHEPADQGCHAPQSIKPAAQGVDARSNGGHLLIGRDQGE